MCVCVYIYIYIERERNGGVVFIREISSKYSVH